MWVLAAAVEDPGGEGGMEGMGGREQIELQLRRHLDEQQGSQVRNAGFEPVPPGYTEAVAGYFRRLSKTSVGQVP